MDAFFFQSLLCLTEMNMRIHTWSVHISMCNTVHCTMKHLVFARLLSLSHQLYFVSYLCIYICTDIQNQTKNKTLQYSTTVLFWYSIIVVRLCCMYLSLLCSLCYCNNKFPDFETNLMLITLQVNSKDYFTIN